MNMIEGETIDIPLDEIYLHFSPEFGTLQDVEARIERLKDVFLAPTEPPPIRVVFEEGIRLWNCLDGRHRCVAARKLGKTHLRAKVFRSTTEQQREGNKS